MEVTGRGSHGGSRNGRRGRGKSREENRGWLESARGRGVAQSEGSSGAIPASFAPVSPSEGKRTGGASSSLSPGDPSAASPKTRILLGAQPCSLAHLFPTAPSHPRKAWPVGVTTSAQPTGSRDLSYGHHWRGAAGSTRCNHSYFPLPHQKGKNCCFLL